MPCLRACCWAPSTLLSFASLIATLYAYAVYISDSLYHLSCLQPLCFSHTVVFRHGSTAYANSDRLWILTVCSVKMPWTARPTDLGTLTFRITSCISFLFLHYIADNYVLQLTSSAMSVAVMQQQLRSKLTLRRLNPASTQAPRCCMEIWIFYYPAWNGHSHIYTLAGLPALHSRWVFLQQNILFFSFPIFFR